MSIDATVNEIRMLFKPGEFEELCQKHTAKELEGIIQGRQHVVTLRRCR
jgi:hypothetical protein